MKTAARERLPQWDLLAWASLAAALTVTASAEYGLARGCGFGHWVAAGVPAALDIYAVRAFRAHRDVPAAVGAMIVVNTLAHLVDAGKLRVSVPLVVVVSMLAPLVVWRVHSLGSAPRPKGEPVGQPTVPLPPVGAGGSGPTGPVVAEDFAPQEWEQTPGWDRPVPEPSAGAEAPALPPAAPALPELGPGSPAGSPGPSGLPAPVAPGSAAVPGGFGDEPAPVPAEVLDTSWDSSRSRTDEELLELAGDLAAAGESTSASALMRHFGIGASRAGRIRDALNSPAPGRESAA